MGVFWFLLPSLLFKIYTMPLEKIHTLPDFGDDWLEDLRDMYIILSLSKSNHQITMFWLAHDLGYTDSIISAGLYHKDQVLARIDRYNNGISTVAIPCTRDALCTLGLYPVVADYTNIDKFMTLVKTVVSK